jgi:hypothetical protein
VEPSRMNFAQIGRLSVAHSLHAFVERKALPGTGTSTAAFWSVFAESRAAAFQFMDLRRSNRKKVNGTTDECPNNRAVYADVLQVAAQNQFEAVRDGPRIPVSNDFGD